MKTVKIDGYCPILTCTEDGEHEHPVCEACGAVNHGNINCQTCIKNRDLSTESQEILFAALREDGQHE